MKTIIIPLLLGPALVILPGCLISGDFDEGCTEEARSSVQIYVEDDAGLPLAGASVTYSVDGGAFVPATCVDAADPTSCTAYVAGWEIAGNFEVRVEKDGYITKEFGTTIKKTPDGCHVESQSFSIGLARDEIVACSDVAVASVMVSVSAANGEPIAGATVTWQTSDDPVFEAECIEATASGDCMLWVAGYEVSGTIYVYASADGYEAGAGSVVVGKTEDGCHVITEELELVLADSPDEPLPGCIDALAIVVTPVTAEGYSINDASVSASYAGGSFATASCTVDVDGTGCPEFGIVGQAGDYLVKVERTGSKTVWSEVLVPADDAGCVLEAQKIAPVLEPEDPTCSDEPNPSVLVFVTDLSGNALYDSYVTYQYNDGYVLVATCAEDDDDTYCATFSAGTDEVGTFRIQVEKEGYLAQEQVVNVPSTDDGCHAATQHITVALEPEFIGCTEEVRPSVIISVTDENDAVLTGATVTYSVDEGAFQSAWCADGEDAENCFRFVAGSELEGEFLIIIKRDGYQTAYLELRVSKTDDGCHVETVEETVKLVLQE